MGAAAVLAVAVEAPSGGDRRQPTALGRLPEAGEPPGIDNAAEARLGFGPALARQGGHAAGIEGAGLVAGVGGGHHPARPDPAGLQGGGGLASSGAMGQRHTRPTPAPLRSL